MMQTISPKYPNIKNDLDSLYHVMDHMPTGEFQIRDTLKDVFQKVGLDSSKTFFLFDHYLYFEPYKNNAIFTGFMFPVGCSKQYLKFFPNFTLSFDNKTKFNCVMNKPRYQRKIISVWLANYFDSSKFNYTKSWDTNFNELKKFLSRYNLDLENKDLDFNWIDYLSNPSNNYLKETTNAEVFNNALYPTIFSNTSVSIVSEPINNELGCMITEKYINAVYAGTIPLVDGYLIGEMLDKIGFDIFNDIIDYSYHYEKNSLVRIKKMLDSNKQLLNNSADIIQNDTIKQRLTANFHLIRDLEKLAKNVIFNLNSYENIQRYKELSVNFNSEITKFVNQVIKP
jgi:hypothetical protein